MNMGKVKKITTSLLVFALLLVPLHSVHGSFIDRAQNKLQQSGNAAGVSKEEGDLGTMIGSGIRIVLQLVGVIFLVLMVYAGFLWMTSRGQEDKIEKARDIMTATVIGMFIVITAYAITVLVTGSVT
ncbi:MAG: hypothetical protein ABEJ02_00685 [Candidatus Paceibacteria bacterium]